jgi:hypothetical protein
MRATPPLGRHHGHHSTMRASSRPPAPMSPLHFPTNMNQEHLHCHCHYLTKAGLRCGASKEGTTPIASSSHVRQGTHPREPHVVGDMVPYNGASNSRGYGAPSRENDATRAPLPSPLNGVNEGLRPTQHHVCHMFLTKSVARSFSPPQCLHWKKPDTT